MGEEFKAESLGLGSGSEPTPSPYAASDAAPKCSTEANDSHVEGRPQDARLTAGAPGQVVDLEGALGQWLDSFAVIASHSGGRKVLDAFATYLRKISAAPEQRMREFMATMEPEVAKTFVSN